MYTIEYDLKDKTTEEVDHYNIIKFAEEDSLIYFLYKSLNKNVSNLKLLKNGFNITREVYNFLYALKMIK